jgi:hypothetical protein
MLIPAAARLSCAFLRGFQTLPKNMLAAYGYKRSDRLRANSLHVWLPGQPSNPTILLKREDSTGHWTHAGELFKQGRGSAVASLSDWRRAAPPITQKEHVERLLFWKQNRAYGIRAYLHLDLQPQIDHQTQAGMSVYLRFDRRPNSMELIPADENRRFSTYGKEEMPIRMGDIQVDVNDASHLIIDRNFKFYTSIFKDFAKPHPDGPLYGTLHDGPLHVYLERFF